MELLVVIIVIAVLTAIAVPKFAQAGVRSKEDALKDCLKTYRNAVQQFVDDTGTLPANLAALSATTAPANGMNATGGSKAIVASDWSGPYIVAGMNDPVSGNPLSYGVTSPNVGKITSSATGTALDGTAYSAW
jgi:type II secretory pathway pseudopilin PulG